MTRKDFLKTAAGAVAASALPATASAAAATEWKGPKRGVSIYSYVSDLFVDHTLEDCFAEIGDLGTENYPLGFEILTGGIEGYPNPSDAYVKNWHDMCAKYHIKPVELGHWVDSKLYNEFEPWLSTKESYEQLVQDIKLANRLGFTCGRTKIGVIDVELFPVPNWREIIKMALPVAEKYNFRMLTEVHNPTLLKSRVIDEYLDFITKEKCTPWFGFNIDFGCFQHSTVERNAPPGTPPKPLKEGTYNKPEDFKLVLPYTHCCHAKFNAVTKDCEDITTPYPEIMKILKEANWNNYMVSEYEGGDKRSGGAFAAVRRQHVLLRKLLGEA